LTAIVVGQRRATASAHPIACLKRQAVALAEMASDGGKSAT